ncbi:MAG: cyclic di-GMP-binding protein FimX [Gammaproteobacteria bacterium]|nr:MAG: cyclic di-GMP-binding protein FimX [Gammaproteobacteria bacterium]
MEPVEALQLLVIESTSNDVEALLNALRNDGVAVASRHLSGMQQLEGSLAEGQWDLLLCATNVEGVDIVRVVEMASAEGKDIPVVVIHDQVADDAHRAVVDALAAGAKDAVQKTDVEHLKLVLRREIESLGARRDVHRWRDALSEREERWRALLEASRDPIAYVHDGMHIHANPTYLDMFGFDSIDELAGLPVLDLVVADDQGRFRDFMRAHMKGESEGSSIEVAGLRSDGNRLDIRMELSPATFQGELCWQLVVRDQSESNEIRAQLEYLRKHDPLTGLYNRQYFMSTLEKVVIGGARADSGRMLLYLELDNFNVLKETIGIGATDMLIAEIARALLGRVPEGGVLSRFGDSVFTLMIQVPHIRAAWDVAEGLRSAVGERIVDVSGKSVTSTCSIGICPMLSRARAPETVLAHAQHSCRTARKQGGNRIEIHFPAGSKPAAAETKAESPGKVVAQALDRGQLSMLYQPIVNLHEDNMEVYEVYLRVVGESGRPLSEASIFSAEVDAEVVTKLDQWVIERVIELMADRQRGGHETYFFVKLSEQAIVDESMLLFISKRLRNAQISGKFLVLKVSEASAMSQVKNVKAFIKGLKQLDCHAALEHFGTGLTSFNTLRHVPVDYLKIDADLVHTLATDHESQSAVRSIVDMARSLRKRVVAVGVEDAATLAMLWDMGVHFAQGDGIQVPSESLEWDFAGSEIG